MHKQTKPKVFGDAILPRAQTMIKYSDESKARADSVRERLQEKPERTIKTPKQLAVVQQQQCTGCIACIQFCPVDCIEISPGVDFPDMQEVVEIDLDRCIGCKLCVKACPWDTIYMIGRDETYDIANEWTLRSVIHDKIESHDYWKDEEEAAPKESVSEVPVEASATEAQSSENTESDNPSETPVGENPTDGEPES